jgi:hypothetical protein
MCGHSVAFQKVDQALLRDEHCSSEFEKVDYTPLSIKTQPMFWHSIKVSGLSEG